MANTEDDRTIALPQVNYGAAIARAVEWLGDRYLLAKPINGHSGGPVRNAGVSDAVGSAASRRGVAEAVSFTVL